MSSSPAREVGPLLDVQAFPYADLTRPGGPSGAAAGPGAGEEAAREQGRREGEAHATQTLGKQAEDLRAEMRAVVVDFARERSAYFERVETEVVQLALAIARKVLHREVQLDPLVLAGIAHVVLDKMDKGTRTSLRVHPQNVAEWRAYFLRSMGPQEAPEIVEDAAMAPDRCRLETALGTAELGLEVQLKEIEQGLLDVLAQRPAGGK